VLHYPLSVLAIELRWQVVDEIQATPPDSGRQQLTLSDLQRTNQQFLLPAG
jgi:ribosome-binding protein aMBF1 (putative translation factor)